jgi:hypothetical protein
MAIATRTSNIAYSATSWPDWSAIKALTSFMDVLPLVNTSKISLQPGTCSTPVSVHEGGVVSAESGCSQVRPLQLRRRNTRETLVASKARSCLYHEGLGLVNNPNLYFFGNFSTPSGSADRRRLKNATRRNPHDC